MNDKPKKNTLCHWCRKSKNRDYKNLKLIYTDCILCKQTYCNICIKRLPNIKPNNEGCMSCKKTCVCFSKNNDNMDKCYKVRRRILLNKKKLLKINKHYNFEKIQPKIKVIISKQNNIQNDTPSIQLNISDKRKFFTPNSVFNIDSIYVIDSLDNLYLKPYKKRRLINIINIED